MGIAGLSEADSVWRGYSKSQLLRIMMQLLLDMGYHETVKTLERESSCAYQCPRVNQLEEAIRGGNMTVARNVLSQLKIPSEIRMASSFLCSQHSFAMAVYHQNLEEALKVLRDDLCPSAFDEDTQRRVQICASLLAYPSPESALRSELKWEPRDSLSRLWTQIQQLLSPDLCVPPSRFLTLCRQAVELQQLYCPNHATSGNTSAFQSLYEDHSCGDAIAPSRCVARLGTHVNEVWDLGVSPDGAYVATCGKDENVILWRSSEPFERVYQWCGHRAPVISVRWSSDSALCATIDKQSVILLWSPTSSRAVGRMESHYGTRLSLCWLPGRHALLAGGIEKDVILYEVLPRCKVEEDPTQKSPAKRAETSNSTSAEAAASESARHEAHSSAPTASETYMYRFRAKKRCRMYSGVRCVSVNMDGTLAVFSSPDWLLHVLDLVSFRELPPLPENAAITVVTCSALHNQVLVSVTGGYPVIRLWDLDDRRVVQTYRGHREDRYVLKCAFGGPGERFVISGSEDAQIYVWNKILGTLVSVIDAHSSTVNAVGWGLSPGDYLFSASDDHTVGVWDPLPAK
ncbi:WD domain, G-beta repeat containing protein, putative [Babesia caballi]|uniref:WD domain, G-beta repeat containing protein, putative n=1 Tax=Babesia caballi TaxID=5871 RepID=A0AAV4LXJ4_BABCB|nr:WD domain, G-beta repeat containing protein, putative [Babesia caballi]